MWDDSKQKQLEDRLIRLTASAGLPLTWVENPEFLAFLDKFIPGAKAPSRKVLTQRLLPQTLSVLRAQAKKSADGHAATVQCDGWTAENFHHFIAFMITADRKVHTVRVHDASNERKTAESLLRLMEDVIQELETKWHVEVVAFTTDASGESRKARAMLVARYPKLVTPDCYGHQKKRASSSPGYKAKHMFLL
ncbi:predicted protein [Postia placenta Mad-698-R]|nr:predicted protein [Postia placenta Mad-698-R]